MNTNSPSNSNSTSIYTDNNPSPLKAICNRYRVFPPGGPDPNLDAVICAFEQKLQTLRANKPLHLTEWSDVYIDWKLIHDDHAEKLEELQQLRTVAIHPRDNIEPLEQKTPPSKWAEPGPAPHSQPPTLGPASGPNAVQPGPSPAPAHFPDSAPAEDAASEDQESKPKDPDPYNQLNPELADAALDLAEQTSPGKSPLDKLPERDREAIFNLLQEHSAARVAELLRRPPPIGLNFKIAVSSIKRFKRRYDKERNFKEGLANIDLVAKSFKSDRTDQSVLIVIERLIKSRLLRRTADPRSTAREIQTLVRALNSLRRQTLTEQKTLFQLTEAQQCSKAQ